MLDGKQKRGEYKFKDGDFSKATQAGRSPFRH